MTTGTATPAPAFAGLGIEGLELKDGCVRITHDEWYERFLPRFDGVRDFDEVELRRAQAEGRCWGNARMEDGAVGGWGWLSGDYCDDAWAISEIPVPEGLSVCVCDDYWTPEEAAVIRRGIDEFEAETGLRWDADYADELMEWFFAHYPELEAQVSWDLDLLIERHFPELAARVEDQDDDLTLPEVL